MHPMCVRSLLFAHERTVLPVLPVRQGAVCLCGMQHHSRHSVCCVHSVLCWPVQRAGLHWLCRRNLCAVHSLCCGAVSLWPHL